MVATRIDLLRTAVLYRGVRGLWYTLGFKVQRLGTCEGIGLGLGSKIKDATSC